MCQSSPQFVTSKDGTKIAYEVSGSGPTLIYIAGASSFRKYNSMQQTAKVFSKHFTVYNYDRRGRGDSSDSKLYTVEKEVDDIEALIHVAGGQVFLYGHSAGAILALEAALKLKGKIIKAVIYDPPYVRTKEEQAKYGELANNVAFFLGQKNYSQAMKCFLVGIGIPKFFTWLMPIFPGWKTMCELAPTLMYDIELTRNFLPLERLKQISIPLLVLSGSKSMEQLRSVSPQVASAIPGWSFEEIIGQSHMVEAKALLPKLVDFLCSTTPTQLHR